MRTLHAEDIIRVMREEWGARVKALTEVVDMVMDSRVGEQGDLPVISPDLKIRHKKSGIRYTVCSVGPRDIILKTPEADEFLIDKEELEKFYELD